MVLSSRAAAQGTLQPLTNIVYVGNYSDGSVSVIDGATDTVTATITVGNNPNGVAVLI
jgi:YVTN family beta-propeller protein